MPTKTVSLKCIAKMIKQATLNKFKFIQTYIYMSRSIEKLKKTWFIFSFPPPSHNFPLKSVPEYSAPAEFPELAPATPATNPSRFTVFTCHVHQDIFNNVKQDSNTALKSWKGSYSSISIDQPHLPEKIFLLF